MLNAAIDVEDPVWLPQNLFKLTNAPVIISEDWFLLDMIAAPVELFVQVSEGLDFADRAGRAVVVTGIPFAMKMDPKVPF